MFKKFIDFLLGRNAPKEVEFATQSAPYKVEAPIAEISLDIVPVSEPTVQAKPETKSTKAKPAAKKPAAKKPAAKKPAAITAKPAKKKSS